MASVLSLTGYGCIGLWYDLCIITVVRNADIKKISSIGACTLVVVLYPKFRSPEWRPVRALMFSAMGLSAVVPVLHGLKMYGRKQLELQMGLSWVVSQGILYILGAAIYAVRQQSRKIPSIHKLIRKQARIPERWKPGVFDIWGNSHQVSFSAYGPSDTRHE